MTYGDALIELNDSYEIWKKIRDPEMQRYTEALGIAVELIKEKILEESKQKYDWKQDKGRWKKGRYR